MMTLTLTEAAAARIKVINDENNKKERLRIAVQGGGCSGFQYTFLMDDHVLSDDLVFENNGAEIVIDEVSLALLDGSVLDYQDDLTASMFVITNPNAKTGCGCGNSFSI
ncbi:MAG: iron-sulfur cluster insertion protein ErpA [Alphaproteobacteria bacterium]|nr:iron-sulfur cluster insertion protein ErpA [Alphaproteobacteria bacterium]